MGKAEFAGWLRHFALITESLEPAGSILIDKKPLHILIAILRQFQRKKRVEIIAHGNALDVASCGMLHLHLHPRSDGEPIFAVGICHTTHLCHNLLDFRILILNLHLIQTTFKFRFRPSVRHQFPGLHGSLLRNALRLHVAGYLVHHANQSRFEVILTERNKILQFVQYLMVDAHLPVSYQTLPVFGFRSSIASHQFQEERLIESILPVFLLQLVDERKPHLLIHSLKGSPVEHIISPMTFGPGTLALESHVMNTFHDELSHTIIEYLALDLTIHHLTYEFLHLFTSFRNRHFQGKEMNQIILQRVFLQIPRHGCACRIRNLYLPRLTEVVQHLQVILRLRQILVILVFHLISSIKFTFSSF